MNWPRVKTAFIILLLVCNVVLFYVYKESYVKETSTDEDSLIIEMQTKLEKNEIDVKDIIPIRKNTIPILKMSDLDLDFDKEKERLIKLGLEPYSDKKQSGYLFACNLDGSLDAIYYGDTENIEYSDFNVALKTANKLVLHEDKDINFEYSNYKRLEDNSFEIYYEQTYSDIRILDGYTLIKVKGDTVLSFEQKFVRISKDSEKTQDLIPYSLALYKLYGEAQTMEKPIKFTDVNIVKDLLGQNDIYYRFVSDDNRRVLIEANKP